MKKNCLYLAVIVALLVLSGDLLQPTTASPKPSVTATPTLNPYYSGLLNKAQQHGGIQVIAQFAVPQSVSLFGWKISDQLLIQITRQIILSDLAGYNVTVLSDDDWPIPFIGLNLDEPALRHLLANPLIIDVGENFSMPAPQTIHPTQVATAAK